MDDRDLEPPSTLCSNKRCRENDVGDCAKGCEYEGCLKMRIITKIRDIFSNKKEQHKHGEVTYGYEEQ